MLEVVRQFQGKHIFFKGNEVHVYLRYSVFVEQVVFVQLLVTLNGSSRHKQDVDVFVVLFLPVVTLEDDFIHCLDSWAHDEHNAGVLRLVHKFVWQDDLLLYLTRLRKLPNDVGEDFEQARIEVKRHVCPLVFQVSYELALIVLTEEREVKVGLLGLLHVH
jgi:hypothetical protein